MIFLLELKIFGESVQRTHENSKNDGFCEELLHKNDFEAVLSTLFCYDNGASVFGVVQKIATDQKYYQWQMLFVRYSSLSQSETAKKGWLLGHLQRSLNSCRSCTKKGEITGPWGVVSTIEGR